MTTPAEPAVQHRLGYLLKHANLAFAEHSASALASLQINGRELAVLTVLSADQPLAQHQAAGRLGVDRTTMVDLVDELERKALVSRGPDPSDRRRNLVHLTAKGRRVLTDGALAAEQAERQFLTALSPAEQDQFRSMLRRILGLDDNPA
jgi:DNA-binding MarR family transcriptional regulator